MSRGGLTAVDTILTLVPMLTPNERKQVCDALSVHPSPCIQLGHQYKTTGKVIRWFLPPVSYCYCARCGKKIKV